MRWFEAVANVAKETRVAKELMSRLKHSSVATEQILEIRHMNADIKFIRSRGATWGSGVLLEAVKPESCQQARYDVHPDLHVKLYAEGQ